MLYKTIVLELLQDRPELYHSLQAGKVLLPTIYRCAAELKESHEVWEDRLSRARPGSDANQVASEALELALKDLENRLLSGSAPAETDPPSLDGAMAFIRRHTPPA